MKIEDISIYLGLVHYPVLNKLGEEITTSVTNLDVHDMARMSRTFGFSKYFIITPIKAQQELIQRLVDHWNTGAATRVHGDRQEAIGLVELQSSFEDCLDNISSLEEGKKPIVCVTGANFSEVKDDLYNVLRESRLDNRPIFLLFGTGWGLSPKIVEKANYCLSPIKGLASDGYNHLSVRAAVAIYCERLSKSFEKICSEES